MTFIENDYTFIKPTRFLNAELPGRKNTNDLSNNVTINNNEQQSALQPNIIQDSFSKTQIPQPDVQNEEKSNLLDSNNILENYIRGSLKQLETEDLQDTPQSEEQKTEKRKQYLETLINIKQVELENLKTSSEKKLKSFHKIIANILNSDEKNNLYRKVLKYKNVTDKKKEKLASQINKYTTELIALNQNKYGTQGVSSSNGLEELYESLVNTTNEDERNILFQQIIDYEISSNLGNDIFAGAINDYENEDEQLLNTEEIPLPGNEAEIPTKEELIENAFAFDGENTKAQSSDLQYKYVIEKPLFYTFNIPKIGKPNSTITGKGNYGTGRIDDYTAKYDAQGRLTYIKANNENFGSNIISYSYDDNGEFTESERSSLGTLIETVFNNDGTIKNHLEYLHVKDKNNNKPFIERNYYYSFDETGNPIQVMTQNDGIFTTTLNPDGSYSKKSTSKKQVIENAFAFDGENTKEESRELQYDYIIEKPLFYTFNIPKIGEPNSTITGKGNYGTGRIDNYTAKYDAQGRLISVITVNKKFGTNIITYSYNDNGEFTESERSSLGTLIETLFNANGSIKQHIEYLHAEDKDKTEPTIERNYSYSVDELGNPVQVMTQDNGIYTTTLNPDGKYSKVTRRV